MPVESSDSLFDTDNMTRVSRNLLKLMHRTEYRLIQVNGQRRYGGPPPCWTGPPPPKDSEIFVGKIPRNCYEDELVPVFEKVGKIYELRLMMDFSGSNRGYAFVMYTNPGVADRAVKILNDYEIRRGRRIGVVKSVNNCRLFIGGLPGNAAATDIKAVIQRLTEGVVDIWVHPSVNGGSRGNFKGRRGAKYAIVEYASHRAAAMARRRLIPERVELWGREIVVDWVAAGHVRGSSGFQPEEIKTTGISQRPFPHRWGRSRRNGSQGSPSPTSSTCSSSLESWSLERAMDEELYGTYTTAVFPKDDEQNSPQSAVNMKCDTLCIPKSLLYTGQINYSTNPSPVHGNTKNGTIRELNSFGGLAAQIIESQITPNFNVPHTKTNLHDYKENQSCINFETPCNELHFILNTANETCSNYVHGPTENNLPEFFADLTVTDTCTQPLYNRDMLICKNKKGISERPLIQSNYLSQEILMSNLNFPHGQKEVSTAYLNQNSTLWGKSSPNFNRAPGAPLVPANINQLTSIPKMNQKSFNRPLKSF